MKRIAILAASGALLLTPALGAWSAFAASGDGSSATTHARVSHRHHGEAEPGDDHGRHGEAEPGDDHGRHHGGHHRHGGDDGPGHD